MRSNNFRLTDVSDRTWEKIKGERKSNWPSVNTTQCQYMTRTQGQHSHFIKLVIIPL